MFYVRLREEWNGRVSETPIFFDDRSFVSLGRHRLCDYRLLPSRTAEANLLISRIQATIERRGDEWILHRGSVPESEISGVPVGASESPFWIDGEPVRSDAIHLRPRSEICIFKDAEASVSIQLMDDSESSLIGDTQPFDLIESIKGQLGELEKKLDDRFAQIIILVEGLSQNDHAQSKNLRRFKLVASVGLLVMALIVGANSFVPSNRNFSDKMAELLATVMSAIVSGVLAKDSLDRSKQ